MLCVSEPRGWVGLENSYTHRPDLPTGVHCGPWSLANPHPSFCSSCFLNRLSRVSSSPQTFLDAPYWEASPRTASVLLAPISDFFPCQTFPHLQIPTRARGRVMGSPSFRCRNLRLRLIRWLVYILTNRGHSRDFNLEALPQSLDFYPDSPFLSF